MILGICDMCPKRATRSDPPHQYCENHYLSSKPKTPTSESRVYTLNHIKELEKKVFTSNSVFQEVNDLTGIYYFCVYHPVNKDQFGHRSELIRSIKNKNELAIKDMVNRLKTNLNTQECFTIVVVPSHNSQDNISGIKLVAKQLCNLNWLDGTDCIKRKYTIPSRHGISGRGYTSDEIQKAKASLTIENEELIKNKDILLFDDITTTRATIVSAMKALEEKQPRSIIGIVLGKTDESRNFHNG